MTLNKVPENFFSSTEQSAFAPSVMPPGIEPSEDRMLQGRLFSYADTQRYRVGTNYQMLPINRPKAAVSNHSQDGFSNFADQRGSINYQPNSFDGKGEHSQGIYSDMEEYKFSRTTLTASTQQEIIAKTLNFKQAGDSYRAFTDSERTNLISNLAGDLGQVKNIPTRVRMTAHFYAADADFGTRLAKAVNLDLEKVKKDAQFVLSLDTGGKPAVAAK